MKTFITNKHSFKILFIFFVLGSLLGTYYEEILHLIAKHTYECRSGLIMGPFNPIYGFGVALLIFFLGPHNETRSIGKTWIYASLIGGITEYMESLIYDKILSIKFWDYSHCFLNIAGRTTIPYMLGWGLGGLFLLKWLYPFLCKLLNKVPFLFGNICYYITLIFMISNITLTYMAFGRQVLRSQNIEPLSKIGYYIDQKYNDKYLLQKFPLMQKTD